MTRLPSPIYLGEFKPKYHGDVVDEFINIANDLSVADEEIESVTFEVALWSNQDEPIAGVVPEAGVTVSAKRVDFQINAPATAGDYVLTAVFTINDGQKITKQAKFAVS